LRRDQDERGWEFDGGTLGDEQTQLVEVAMEGAVGGVHAALEAAQLSAGIGVRLADDGIVVEVGAVGDFGDHDFDFGAAEAAKDELGVGEAVDQGALFGSAGVVVLGPLGRDGGAFGGVFPGEDFRLGLNAGFQGILGRAGLALGGAWPGTFLGIETICPDLFDCGHKKRRQARGLSPNSSVRGRDCDFRA